MYRLGNPDVEDPIDVAVPGMPPVWGRRVSALLGNQPAESAEFEARIKPWAEQAAAGDEIAEAVCEFALRDRFSRLPEEQSVREALGWRWSAKWAQSPLLLGSIDGPPRVQQALAAELNGNWQLTTKRDEFAAIRAVSLMVLADWQAPERLSVLQTFYPGAADSNVGSYLIYIASKLVSDRRLCSAPDFDRILLSFRGIDAIGDTAALARTVAQEASNRLKDEPARWIRAIIGFLDGAVDPTTKDQYPEPHDDVLDVYMLASSGYGFDRPRSCFWHELVCFALGELSEQWGVSLLPLLLKEGWYELAFDHRLEGGFGRALRKEANVQLGAAFRNAVLAKSNEHVAVIGSLAEGSYPTSLSASKQREIALFMIRHTSLTHATYKVRVDERLWPHIKHLRDTDGFSAHDQRFLDGLIEANHIN